MSDELRTEQTTGKMPQPATSAQFTSGINSPDAKSPRKQRNIGMWVSVTSILIGPLLLYVGFVSGVAALLGAYGASLGIRSKSILVTILGLTGLALNGVVYALAFF